MDVTREQPIWRPVQPLAADLLTYQDPGLSSLRPVWDAAHRSLEHSSALAEFNEQLARRWAIETGILERLYTLDRGVTNLLIEQGFDAALIGHGTTNLEPTYLVSILDAHRAALNGIFAYVRGDRPLSTSYIKEMHVALTETQQWMDVVDSLGRPAKVEMPHGQWKIHPNNPTRADGTTFLYCPPEQVAGQVEALVSIYQGYQDALLAPEVVAAWLHHAFTQIHPFQDGNGRVARALATFEFVRRGLFPLVIERENRTSYIDSLEQADGGDLRPLIDLFARAQQTALVRALSLAKESIATVQGMQAVAAAFARTLKESYERPTEAVQLADEVAEELVGVVEKRLNSLSAILAEQLASIQPKVRLSVTRSTAETSHYFKSQIVHTAKALKYFVSHTGPKHWVRLHVRDGIRADLIFSFHSLGSLPRGAMACSAFSNVRLERDQQEPAEWHTEPACEDAFVFSHATLPSAIQASFTEWVDRSIQLGLEGIRRFIDFDGGSAERNGPSGP